MQSLNEIVRDLASSKLLSALSQGCIIGVLLVVIEVSFASIIFSGQLAEHATRAAGLTIFGAMTMSLFTAFFSSFRSMVSLPQDSPVAVLSGTSAAIAGLLAAASPETQFATVTAVMALSALVTAVVFLLVGHFKLSNLVRFLPYPVVGGFLAGSGVTLFLGGFGVMTGKSLTLDTLVQFASWPVMQFWLPGAAYALIVFAFMKLRPHFMILPISFALSVVVFHAVLYFLGVSPDAARADGWLLGALPATGLWPAFGMADAAAVDWGAVLAQLPDLFTVALLSLVGLLLNVGGIELGARQDIDMDQELLVGAVGNAAAGLGGGFAGFGSLALSMLGPRTGTDTRLIPLFSALVCAGVLFLGAETLTFFPKALLGGLVLLLGLFFLDDWIIASWKRLTPVDYGIVLVITLAIANIGFLEGVGLGLLLAVFFFVFRLSRVPVIEKELTGDEAQSSKHRPVTDRALLRARGSETHLFRLRGYVFFGSANALATRAAALLAAPPKPPRFILLDLAAIDGFDISAVNIFQRMAQQAQAKGAMLLFSAVPHGLFALLTSNTSPAAMAHVRRFSRLDEALEWTEETLLSEEHAALGQGEAGAGRRDALFALAADDLDAHLAAMERFEALVERMGTHVANREFEDGAELYHQGEDPGGSYLILRGSVGVTMRLGSGTESRIRSLGPGGIAAPLASVRPYVAPGTALAEGKCVTVFLSREGLTLLEEADPQAALAFHRLVARTLGRRADGR